MPKNLRKQQKKDLEKMLAPLRKKITKQRAPTAEIWKNRRTDESGKSLLKDGTSNFRILTDQEILNLLKKKHENDPEKIAVIKKFEWLRTLLGDYSENRENYYSDKDQVTAVSHRIVNVNLIRFSNNILASRKFPEDLQNKITDEEKKIFTPENFDEFLTQEWIEKYNKIIGGFVDENGAKIQGINEKINLRKQKNPGERKDAQKLEKLYKQIGAKTEKITPFRVIETPEQFRELLQEFLQKSQEKSTEIKNLLQQLRAGDFDFDSLRLSKTNFSKISNDIFGNRTRLAQIAVDKKIRKKGDKNSEEIVKTPERIPLAAIKEILDAVPAEEQNIPENCFKTHRVETAQDEGRNFENLRDFFVRVMTKDLESLFDGKEFVNPQNQKVSIPGLTPATQKLNEILPNLNHQDQDHKKIIKNFADASLAVFQTLKKFTIKEDKIDGKKDTSFYDRFEDILGDYPCPKRYDALRNFLTKKPSAAEKRPIVFDCGSLLHGRDKNKEPEKRWILLKNKDGVYHLAILTEAGKNFFKEEKNPELFVSDSDREKMEYKLLPGPNKMFPKVAFAKNNIADREKQWINIPGVFPIPERIREIREAESHIKNSKKPGHSFSLSDCHTRIRFFQNFLKNAEKLKPDRSYADRSFSPPEHYDDVSRFYNEVEQQGYKIKRRAIDFSQIEKAVDEWKIYLFRIHSKDFSPKIGKKNKENLHTIFWKAAMTPNSSIKLNGEAEIFYRPAQIKTPETIQKKPKIGDPFEITKNQRFTQDKFLFHCPLTLNFGARSSGKFNEKIQTIIRQNFDDVKILGIDRGEKHLAFYSLIDSSGKIIQQGTLNRINGQDYGEKLDELQKNRQGARKNREEIGKIKDLKEGYISQAVHKICELVLEHNAVVVFEDLNTGFKNARKKIEKSVYQKFETALISKLNYLSDKKITLGELGSPTRALQLTPPFTTVGEITGRQRGIVFYTRAARTSQTDPVTGFRKNIFKTPRTGGQEIREKILAFDAIGFGQVPGSSQDAFFFCYDPSVVAAAGTASTKSAKSEIPAKTRTIRSHVDRRKKNKNTHGQRETQKVDLTAELQKLFGENGVDITTDIKSQLASRDFSASFREKLVSTIMLLLQLRNGDSAWNDLIISPVEPFFDSREFWAQAPEETDNDQPRPTSGDANGAFNIARKGLMTLQKIKSLDGFVESKDLFIPDAERDQRLQNNQQ